MHPDNRGNRARRFWRWFLVWFFATAAVLVIGLVVEQAVSPSPADHWGEPPSTPIPHAAPATRTAAPVKPAATPAASAPALTGPLQVVQGRQLINGVYLGYPHSTVGAVSAADEFLSSLESTLDPDRAAAVMRLAAGPSYANGPQQAAAGITGARKDLGLPVSGPVPQGASIETEPMEYQVRDVTPDGAMVLLLCDVVTTMPNQGTQTKAGVIPVPMEWAQGDWKIRSHPSGDYDSLYADPDSPQAASLGWQQLEPAG